MNSNTTSSLASGTILHGEVYNYKIIKVLGQGSYGITYLAEYGRLCVRWADDLYSR